MEEIGVTICLKKRNELKEYQKNHHEALYKLFNHHYINLIVYAMI